MCIFSQIRFAAKREDMFPEPASPYAISNPDCEHLARMFYTDHGLHTTCLCDSNVYEPRHDSNSPYAAAIPIFRSARVRVRILCSMAIVGRQALNYIIKIDGVTKITSSSYIWETDYSSAGTYTIDITVSDGIEQVTGQRTITINNVHPRWDVKVNVQDMTIAGYHFGETVA